MAKRKSISKAQATAHLQGPQQTAGGMQFDPSGARAGQNSAWGSPWWSLRRPSVEKASRTLNVAMESARLRPLDPPDVSQVSQFSVDLRPVI